MTQLQGQLLVAHLERDQIRQYTTAGKRTENGLEHRDWLRATGDGTGIRRGAVDRPMRPDSKKGTGLMRAICCCGLLDRFVADDFISATPNAETGGASLPCRLADAISEKVAAPEIPIAVSVAGTARSAGNGQRPPGQSFPAGADSAGVA
jgi:hypothetical protein